MSRLDIVLFGASGFTGQHALEQLAIMAEQRGLTWGVAGRNRDKLTRTMKTISDKTGKNVVPTKILIADVGDERSLRDMCHRAKVLVNCCGPYMLYGDPVVRAAIHCRTHYVDVSGEPNFIELMHVHYEEQARAAGVYVVSACAFESIPADLGVIFLQQNFGGVLNTVECYMSADTNPRSINYGTWHSLINNLSHFMEIREIRKHMNPTPLPKFTPGPKFRFPVHKRHGGWCLLFPNNDPTSVARTQRHLYENEGVRPVHFSNYVKFDSLLLTLAVASSFLMFFVLSQFSLMRWLMLEYPGVFSLGVVTRRPALNVVKSAAYEYILHGEGWDHSDRDNIDKVPPTKTVIAKVSGLNPGYGMTVMGVLFSALAILKEPHNLPPGGGVMTPGMAFGKTELIKNLQEHGVSFQIDRTKQHEE